MTIIHNNISIPKVSRSGRIYLDNNGNGGTSTVVSTTSGGETTSNLIGKTTIDTTFLGFQAGNNFTGNTSYNTFIGTNAGYSGKTGFNNTFIGYQAGCSINGSRNVVLGANAGACFLNISDALVISNSSSITPLIYGDFSTPSILINGKLCINGLTCCSTGDALFYNTGTGEITRGTGAGGGLCGTTNTANTFLGSGAGAANNCAWNTFLGVNAGYTNNTGECNINVGHSAGYTNSSGKGNTTIGFEAGYSGTGGGNVMIGYRAGYSETGSAKLYISNCSGTSPLIFGCFSTPMVKINGSLCTTGLITESGTSLCTKYVKVGAVVGCACGLLDETTGSFVYSVADVQGCQFDLVGDNGYSVCVCTAGSAYSALYATYLNNLPSTCYAKVSGGTFTCVITAPNVRKIAPYALTEAATTCWLMCCSSSASLSLTANRNLLICNVVAGDNGILKVTQCGTGSYCLTLPTCSKKITGYAQSTAVGSIDLISYYYDGTYYYWNIGKNYT